MAGDYDFMTTYGTGQALTVSTASRFRGLIIHHGYSGTADVGRPPRPSTSVWMRRSSRIPERQLRLLLQAYGRYPPLPRSSRNLRRLDRQKENFAVSSTTRAGNFTINYNLSRGNWKHNFSLNLADSQNEVVPLWNPTAIRTADSAGTHHHGGSADQCPLRLENEWFLPELR